jgi:hypothetical protein
MLATFEEVFGSLMSGTVARSAKTSFKSEHPAVSQQKLVSLRDSSE